MAILAKEWGLDGSLHAFTDSACTWDSLEWNNGSWIRSQDPNPTDEELDGKALIETVDGFPTLVLRRELGDPGWGFPTTDRIRLEAAFSDWTSQLADWVDEEEEGADPAEAYRWYRYRYRMKYPTAYLSQTSSDPFALAWQIFHRLDTNPEDTVGIPALSGGLWMDAYGRVRHRIVQSTGSETLNSPANVTTEEIASWTCSDDEWNDIVIQARWSHSSLGELRMWRNLRPIVERIGVANCHNNAPSRGGGGLRPKVSGPYAGPWSLVQNLEYTAYHTGLIIGDGEYSLANFQQMFPENPSVIPLERVSGPVGSLI